MSCRLVAVAAGALVVLAACSDTHRDERAQMEATWDEMTRDDQRWLCAKSHDERRAVLDEIGGGIDNAAAAKRLDELCAVADVTADSERSTQLDDTADGNT